MNKTMKRMLTGGLIIIASLYLTFLIDAYTLNTMLKRVFVFGYFVVMSLVFVYLKGKFCNNQSAKWKLRLIAVGVSLLLLVVFQNQFLPLQKENLFSLQATASDMVPSGGEVWLVSAEIDGKEAVLSQLELLENVNWNYESGYDDYVYYPKAEDPENLLTLSVNATRIKLRFASNSWSGVVHIAEQTKDPQILDLYSEQDGNGEQEYVLEAQRVYTILERGLYNFGALTVLAFFVELVLGYYKGRQERKSA